ncbi:MAG: type II toxin-antitoxin system RelE/ParE family toxin [Thermovirgaceae bacterium]|nr:type II toxin-antitoxin system RelE/ParE family toxin [Thermovirgaceae bacterium]
MTWDVEYTDQTRQMELRVQHQGSPIRLLYAFDPRRSAILLIGGDKTGNDRWYEENVPKADGVYEAHFDTLEKEGLIDGKKI